MTVTKLRKTKMHTAKRRKTKRTTTKRRKTKRTTATLRKTKRTTTKRRKTKRTAKRTTTKHLKRTLKGGQNPTIKATNRTSIKLELNNKTIYTLATADSITGNSTVCNNMYNNPVSIEFEEQNSKIILKVDGIEYGKLDDARKGIFITSAPDGSCLTNDYYEFASFDANPNDFNKIKIVLKKHMFTVTDKFKNEHELVYKSKYTLKFPQTKQTNQTTQSNPINQIVTFIYNEKGHIDIISDANYDVGDIIVNNGINKFDIVNGYFRSAYNIDPGEAFEPYNIINIENKTISLEL